MYCTKCGTKLKEDSKFCHNCGATVKPAVQNDPLGPEIFAPTPQPTTQTYSQPVYQQPAQQATNQNDGNQGLLGFIFSFFIPIAGLILSIIGLKKTRYRGLAIAGLIISIVNMVISFILMVVYVAAIGSIIADDPYYYYLASMI